MRAAAPAYALALRCSRDTRFSLREAGCQVSDVTDNAQFDDRQYLRPGGHRWRARSIAARPVVCVRWRRRNRNPCSLACGAGTQDGAPDGSRISARWRKRRSELPREWRAADTRSNRPGSSWPYGRLIREVMSVTAIFHPIPCGLTGRFLE